MDGGPAGAPPGLGWAHERSGMGVDARRAGDGGAVDLGYVERGEITEEQLDKALDTMSMTHPE